MATADLRANIRSMGLEEQLVTMAVTVVVDRIARLSKADRDDFFELAMQAAAATDEEDRIGIRDTMVEILDGHASTLEAADLSGDAAPAHAKWVDYISKCVRDARQEAGLTQDQLAERSGLPQSHISRIETAKLSPSAVTIEKIAAALGREPSYFEIH